MREQPTRIKTGAVKNRAAIITSAVITLALAGIILFLVQYEPPYKPPAFEVGAVTGTPSPPESFGYNSVDAAGKFEFMLAGTFYQQEDASLRIYFNNPPQNEVYLMCEVTDSGGATLYKSGLLRPGEYVESLKPARRLENAATPVEVNVYAFEPDTYYSTGTVVLKNTLQPY